MPQYLNPDTYKNLTCMTSMGRYMDLTHDMAAPAIISTSDSTLPDEENNGKRLWAKRFDFPTGSTPMGREFLRLSASGRRMNPTRERIHL